VGTPTDNQELIDVVREFHQRGWCLATGGNYSRRLTGDSMSITASGGDKGRLTEQRFLRADLTGRVLDSDLTPSAETLLHARLYALDPGIGAVLHTHSVSATVLSRLETAEWLTLNGYEMLKALTGNSTHDTSVRVRIFENTQDIASLAQRLEQEWGRDLEQPGFLVRGHGLYAWGADVAQAKRHLEGFEFLFACELEARRAGGYPVAS